MDADTAEYVDGETFAQRYHPPTLVMSGAHIMTKPCHDIILRAQGEAASQALVELWRRLPWWVRALLRASGHAWN